MYQTKVLRKIYHSVIRCKDLCAKNSNICVPSVARFGTKTSHAVNENLSAFMGMVESRRAQARRSLIIEVPTLSYVSEVKTNCEKYGEIHYFDYYSLQGNLDFVIVEFKSEESANCVLNDCVYESDHNVVPVRSPFLWYRTTKIAPASKKLSKELTKKVLEKTNEKELIKKLGSADSLNEQMIILDRETSLTDLGIRLRFLTLYQIELALSGLFPRITAFPFGSSITGFGRNCCDLDIVINLDKDPVLNNEPSSLVFHVKAASLNGRASMQRHLESIGDIFHLFLPGISNMKRILQANVPIIKYFQDFTGLECDITMNNMSAVNMSELLYNLRLFDLRVQPFVTTIHRWAYHAGLTHTTPGPWITNFSLTLLAIFFLQQDSVSVLPAVNKLRNEKNARSDKPLDTLETLLTLFLDYYSKYDFRNYAVNVLSGTPTLKPDNSPMYIVNPIEPELNVSKNVNSAENEKFQNEIKNAYWLLNAQQVSGGNDKEISWGILPLFKSKRSKQEPIFNVKQNVAKKKNIVISLWNELQ